MVGTPRPKAARKIPKHCSPEQAREFLAMMEGDRTWPVWAFLLGAGSRIGELVPWPRTIARLRWHEKYNSVIWVAGVVPGGVWGPSPAARQRASGPLWGVARAR
jgi:hypothetical protein